MKNPALILVLAIPFVVSAQSAKEAAVCAGNLDAEKPDTAQAVKDFWQDFQGALKKNDTHRVAALATYPVQVNLPKMSVTIRTSEELERNYSHIFPPKFRAFLIGEPLACVGRVGSRGFSVAAGQVWFDRYPDGKVRFFSVNVVLYPGE